MEFNIDEILSTLVLVTFRDQNSFLEEVEIVLSLYDIWKYAWPVTHL